MTFGSICTGIGGLDLGLERSGMRALWMCEIDPFCRRVLAKHWPHVPCYEDLTKLGEGLPWADLLCGGFPCQPHSVAGKRKGKDDERNLWPECIRLVRLLRPRWCLFENVPGLLSTMFGQVCDELRGEGYEVWTLVLGADDVGAPHRRKRVWIIGHRLANASDGGCQKRAQSTEVQGRCGKRKEHQARSEHNRQLSGRLSGLGSCELAIPRHQRLEVTGQRNSRALAPVEASEGMADTSRDDRANGRRKTGSGRGVQQAGEELGISSEQRPQGPELYRISELRISPWPSRPGEPQHDWEAPRLIVGQGVRSNSIKAKPSVGKPTHGISRRLARLRREQLKALGNAVVPQVAELIGRAIMQAEASS